MRQINILISLLLLANSFLSQVNINNVNLNQYKYLVVEKVSGRNLRESRKFLVKNLNLSGYNVVNLTPPLQSSPYLPSDLSKNKNLALYISQNTTSNGCFQINFSLSNSEGNILYQSNGSSCALLSSAIKNAIAEISAYPYKYNPKFNIATNKQIKINNIDIDLNNQNSVRSYFDNNNTDPIEGIYDYTAADQSEYRFVIFKKDYNYLGYILESNNNWRVGEIKFTLDETAVSNSFSIKWTFADKQTKQKSFATLTNSALIEFDLNASKTILYKLYPKINNSSNINSNNESWKGNGSGFFISTNGYIVTNNHVIEKANFIEVEVKFREEIKHYNAKVTKVDVTNDLAIIQIDDPKFVPFKSIPYNFKTRSAEIGTEVYALGYPMALSLMGKDIKFTDGRISSKTGFQGDITTYQTTTPIQPGNSGGPLFDHNGNLLGVNSSGIRKDIADNVSYTIKTNYLLNLIDVLPKSIPLPNSTWIGSKPLTEQIKVLSQYVVLIKIK